MFSIIEIILWLLGFAAAYFVHKKIDALCTENSVGAAEEYISQIKEENDTVWRHYHISGRYFPAMIILGFIVPWTPVKWILFIGGGFNVPAIFYDVFQNNLKRTFESKERLLFTLISAYNLILIAISLFTYYYGYIYVDFSK